MDSLSATMLSFGAVLLFISWVQLMFVSFKEDYTWGLSTLFLPPLAYLYGLFSWEKSQAAIWLSALGWVLIIFSFR